MIISIKFVSVPTHDQDRPLAFYTEKVGFRLITDQPFGPDQRWIELGIGHSDTRFVLFTPPGEQDSVGRRFSGALACDDVDATWRHSWSAASPSRFRRHGSLGAYSPSCSTRKAIASCCHPAADPHV